MKILMLVALMTFAASPCYPETADEKQLKQAIQLCNQGRHQEAVPILEGLAARNPSDDRVFLSLGLAYLSLTRYDEAIGAFERSVSFQSSEAGYYSLGLLYEGKMLADETNAKFWAAKAKSAWNSFLKLNSADRKKAEVASRHLKNLNESENAHR